MGQIHYLELLPYLEEHVDVVKLLYSLGAQHVKIYGSSVRSECIIHGGDNPLAFSYDLNKKIWQCFSNNCGEGYKHNLYNLVYLTLYNRTGVYPPPEEVLSYLLGASDITVDVSSLDFSFNKAMRDRLDNIIFARTIKQRLMSKADNNSTIYLDESILMYYNTTVHPYLTNRGIRDDVAQEFEIKFAPRGLSEKVKAPDFPGRIIFPIRDMHNGLLGLSGRLASDDPLLIKRFGKYRHLANFSRNKVLYNINRACHYISKTKALILVEGFLDVISLWQKGIKNVVGLMGNTLHIDQIAGVLPYIDRVYVCLDGDKGGREGLKKVVKVLRNLCNVYYVKLEEGKDPDDLSKEELVHAFIEAKKIV